MPLGNPQSHRHRRLGQSGGPLILSLREVSNLNIRCPPRLVLKGADLNALPWVGQSAVAYREGDFFLAYDYLPPPG